VYCPLPSPGVQEICGEAVLGEEIEVTSDGMFDGPTAMRLSVLIVPISDIATLTVDALTPTVAPFKGVVIVALGNVCEFFKLISKLIAAWLSTSSKLVMVSV
jgi:hypothetical protein